MDTLCRDIRVAIRSLRKKPGFTVTVILTLALGIGADTTIFSVVHSVLLKPIDYPKERPQDVVVIAEVSSGRMAVSYPTFQDWRKIPTSFENLAGFRNSSVNLTGREKPLRLSVRMTSSNYFEIYGVRPLIGRFYTLDEDRAGGELVTVLSYPLWQSKFGGREDVLGESVTLNEQSFTIVGVLPAGFGLLPSERLFVPLESWAETYASKSRGDHQGIFAVVRLATSSSFAEARLEMEALAKRLEEEYPRTNSGVGVQLDSLEEMRLRNYRGMLLLLLGAVTLLLFALVVSTASGILFGLIPALQTSRTDVNSFLKDGGRNAGNLSGQGLRQTFLVAEVALATVLLLAAGLLVRTLFELTRVDLGFEPAKVLTMNLGLTGERYTRENLTTFYRELKQQVEAVPGVESASVGTAIPMQGSNWTSIFIVEGQPIPARAQLPASAFTPVDTVYFSTLGIRLLQGRRFHEFDRPDTQSVCVVNESLARHFWPGESALGKRLKQGWPESDGPNHPWREVVGVVGDVKQDGLDRESRMETYLPMAQSPQSFIRLVVRSEKQTLPLVEPIRKALQQLDPNIPLYSIPSMDELISGSIAPQRFTMWMLGLFAALALSLAAIGIYGVIAYVVACRTQEMGLRMALGARPGQVFKLVVRQGLVLTTAGLLLGVAALPLVTRGLESLLFGADASDPMMYLGVLTVLGLVAFVASAAPACRATSADPMAALRME